MTLTPQQQEAYSRANSSTQILFALELRHPIWPSPIRIVQNRDGDIDLLLEDSAPIDGGTTQTFTALGFTIDEPDISGEPDAEMQITANIVSNQLQPLMAEANRTGVAIESTLRGFSYNVKTATVLEMLSVYSLQVRGTTVTKTSSAMKLGYTNGANRDFPYVKYTAETNPSLV